MSKRIEILIVALLLGNLIANVFFGIFVTCTFDEVQNKVQNNMQHAANVIVQTNQRSWNATKCIVNKMLNIR